MGGRRVIRRRRVIVSRSISGGLNRLLGVHGLFFEEVPASAMQSLVAALP